MERKKYVECIFINKPEQWGLRGDPVLWEILKDYYAYIKLPYSCEYLENDIYKLFFQITGSKLSRTCVCQSDKLASSKGGISNGTVSGRFWIDKGIPLLKKRLDEANRDYS